MGDHIRLKRLEKGLTQGKVVELIGITMKLLSAWERDLAKPSDEEWSGLASLLELDAAFLPGVPALAERVGI